MKHRSTYKFRLIACWKRKSLDKWTIKVVFCSVLIDKYTIKVVFRSVFGVNGGDTCCAGSPRGPPHPWQPPPRNTPWPPTQPASEARVRQSRPHIRQSYGRCYTVIRHIQDSQTAHTRQSDGTYKTVVLATAATKYAMAAETTCGVGFRLQGLGLRIKGSGFRGWS